MLVGTTLDDVAIEHVGSMCSDGAIPLAETGYKVPLITATVRETLERLRHTV